LAHAEVAVKTHRAWRARAQKGGANWQRARVAVERALRDNTIGYRAIGYQATMMAARIIKVHRAAGGVRKIEEIVAAELQVVDLPSEVRGWLVADVAEAFTAGLTGGAT
jgi:hypothetical protein